MRAGLVTCAAVLAAGLLVATGCDGESTPTDRSGEQPSGQAPSEGARWLTATAAQASEIRGAGLVREIYLGVACREPGSISCDRVGVGVDLQGPVRDVRIWVGGQRVEMRPVPDVPRNRREYWIGYLQPAGLVDGLPGRFSESGGSTSMGERAIAAPVRIVTHASGYWTALGNRAGSKLSATYRSLYLHPGFG
jgi:hypothetical protein